MQVSRIKLELFSPPPILHLHQCVSLHTRAHVGVYMISLGDRILRACNNCRANANAWLVALYQLVLNLQAAHSAAQGLALGQNQKSLALDYVIPERSIFVFATPVACLYLVALSASASKQAGHTLLLGPACPMVTVRAALCYLFFLYLLFQTPFLQVESLNIYIRIYMCAKIQTPR